MTPAPLMMDLTAGEMQCFAQQIDRLPGQPPQESFLMAAALLGHDLPRRLREALLQFERVGNATGAIFLRGLPRDLEVPPTPRDPKAAAGKATHRSEAVLAAIGGMLGHLVGYAQEKQGRIFQNVVPTQANAEQLSSESSKAALDFHTEMAFHPHRPDFLLLYGVRQDPEKMAGTTFAGIRQLLPLLPGTARKELFRRQFPTGVDYSFGNAKTLPGAGPIVRVLSGRHADPFLCYDWDLMAPRTPPACAALARLREGIERVKQHVCIEPGSLLVLDNRRSVHGRTIFQARFDGTDRWLQRVAIVRDLARSAHDRRGDGRVIDTDFARYLMEAGH